MRQFDFYEVVAVIAPGMVLIIGVIFLSIQTNKQNCLNFVNLSLGSLGVGLIWLTAGQLLQVLGNWIEIYGGNQVNSNRLAA